MESNSFLKITGSLYKCYIYVGYLLKIGNNNITNQGIRHLTNNKSLIKKLWYIDLNNNQLGNKGVEAFCNRAWKSLVEVHFGNF